MFKKMWIVVAGVMLAGSLSTMGCDHIENAIDCHGICQRYSDCYDKSYDVDSCETKCKDNANSDKDYMSKADDCNNCLGDKSCASATFNCATQCVGIVP
jgi:hypothetical protein